MSIVHIILIKKAKDKKPLIVGLKKYNIILTNLHCLIFFASTRSYFTQNAMKTHNTYIIGQSSLSGRQASLGD